MTEVVRLLEWFRRRRRWRMSWASGGVSDPLQRWTRPTSLADQTPAGPPPPDPRLENIQTRGGGQGRIVSRPPLVNR